MSLARVHHVKRVRKVWTCDKCKTEIKVGEPAVKFAVGFRGRTRVRCTKSECYPKPSERESSMVASAYAAQEEVSVDSANNLEDLEQIRDDVATAVRDVASEYESSEMYERNYDLQERAEMLNSAADELETWEPEVEEPTEENWRDEYPDCVSFENAHEQWLSDARESLSTAIEGMELP